MATTFNGDLLVLSVSNEGTLEVSFEHLCDNPKSLFNRDFDVTSKGCRPSHGLTKNLSVHGFSPRLTNFLLGLGEDRQPAYRSGEKPSKITQNDHTYMFYSECFHLFDFETNFKISRLISEIHRLINYLS